MPAVTVGDRTWLPLGLSSIALGAAAAFIASGYAMGTVTAMGPGFIPMGVSLFLIAMGGLVIVARGRDVAEDGAADEKDDAPPPAEPLARSPLGAARSIGAIVAAIVIFGLGVKPLGLALTTFLSVIAGAYANPSARPGPALLMAVGLSAGACLLFVALLGLQIGILPRFE
jgi:hypothetical protein